MLAVVAIGWVLSGLPEAPTGSEVEWSVPNAEATYVLKQTAAPGGCHVAVVHDADQQVLWEKDLCLGGKSDRHLLSREGKRLVLIAALPKVPGKGPSDWRRAPVAWLIDQGNVVEEAVAGQFVKDGTEIRKGVSHFSWLQGVGGVPGVPPRLTQDGSGVELEGIDGTHRELAFAGFKLPPLAAEKKGGKRHRRR